MDETTLNDSALAGADSHWIECAADEWSDALVASMKLGGIDHLFFVPGFELAFLPEAVVKAQTLGRPAPRLMTMMHESVALNAAVGYSNITGRPAAPRPFTSMSARCSSGPRYTPHGTTAALLITAGSGPRAFPGSMRGARDLSSTGCRSARSWWHRAAVHEDGASPGASGQSRVDDQPDAAGGDERASRSRLSLHAARNRDAAFAGSRSFPHSGPHGPGSSTWPDPDDARTIAQWLVASQNPVLFTARIGQDPAAIPRVCPPGRTSGNSGYGIEPAGNTHEFSGIASSGWLWTVCPRCRRGTGGRRRLAVYFGVNSPGADAKIRMDQRGPGGSALQDDGIPRRSLAHVHTCQRRAGDLHGSREVAGSSEQYVTVKVAAAPAGRAQPRSRTSSSPG